jgi:hypothetical protein
MVTLMRRAALFAVCLGWLLPANCFALMTSVIGNEDLPAANYTDWPGLVHAVNDPSRVLQVWVNGNESFSYSGDAAALNRVLKKFSQIQAHKLTVILRPGPGEIVTVAGREKQVDWSIRVIGGIARGMIQHDGLFSVWDVDPTLTIYVTDRLDLDAVDIPPAIPIMQLDDLSRRYFQASRTGNERAKIRAAHALESLEKDAQREGEARRDYKTQLKRIEDYVRRRQHASP